MKKRIGLFLCLVLVFSLAGCGSGTAGKTGKQPAGVNDVLEAGMEEADSREAGSGSPAEESDVWEEQSTAAEDAGAAESVTGKESKQDTAAAAEENSGSVDVDLTALSSTMVYSEVNNMMINPEDYIGKTVKMKGSFACYQDESTKNTYFACIIQDATACCAQGIEFVLTDDYTYPDDYPEIDDEICTVGTFDTYQEGEYTYCTLRNARLLS